MRTTPFPIEQGVQPSDTFGRLFCGVLRHLPDAQAWKLCGSYFEPSGTPADVGQPLSSKYRVLVVPGIFGQCVADIARPFWDAVPHLRSAHGIELEYVDVTALGSCRHNAQQIADYLARQPADRQYIAFGYSKGASDLLEAVAAHDIARHRLKAVITVAGSVLGSRLTAGVPRDLADFLQRTRAGSCEVGDGGGIDSMRRSERVRAMARFRAPDGFRAYSIAAVASYENTSDILRQGWRTLQVYSLEQDSQIVHEDAIVPGATYLGFARADHWAVALPFEQIDPSHPQAPEIKRAVNRNHYPRVALFEAALRFVLNDLGQ